MINKRTGEGAGRFAFLGGPNRRRWRRVSHDLTTLVLNVFLIKPIAIFVWWFSHRANTLSFRERKEFLHRIQFALAEGRPVIVALNHVSWFDDPVIPMALYRTGQRAGLELIALGAFVAVCWMLPPEVFPPPLGIAAGVAGAVASGWLGARKVWWTLGDLVNLSDASVLRDKFALTRNAPPGFLLGAVLRLADSAVPWFMRSGATKTVFVDRRPGEEAKRARARAVDVAIECAERLEPVWVFFEGGRSKVPGTIAPARRGIGALLLGLRERGHQPLVVVVYHSGMERLIPPGGSRFLSYGHRVEVRWSFFDVESSNAGPTDAQAVADAVHETAVRLQSSGNIAQATHA